MTKLKPKLALRVLALALPIALGGVISARARNRMAEAEMRAALMSGDYSRVRQWAASVPDPNTHAAPGGMTPLLSALWNGDAHTARLLVARGADVNEASGAETPLHAAVVKIDPGMVRFLLAHGADPTAHTDVADPMAYRWGGTDVLAEAGACHNTLTRFRRGKPYVQCVDPIALRRQRLILPLLQQAVRARRSST